MENRIINNIKSLALDMITKSGSGHPGIVLGSAPIIYTLYSRHLKISKNINNLSRDYFILSAGHGSSLLYSTLFLAGLSLTLDDLKTFRQLGSLTPGHPEYGLTDYVDATTGPLGQGIATSVGIAMGLKKRQLDKYVYTLCGDGDLMEGISYESLSLAGSINLNNLIILYDSNDICLDGFTNITFKENMKKRFESINFYYELVENSTVSNINKAIENAKASNKPSLIEIKTIIGKDSILENTNEVHGKLLTEEDLNQIKTKYNIPLTPFYVDEEAKEYFQNQIMYEDDLLEKKDIDIDFDIDGLDIENTELRNINGIVLNKLEKVIPTLIGGSADVASSTKTILKNSSNFNEDLVGKNIWYGVREHAMAGISIGLSINGFLPFTSTFLAFADYMKPSIRIACLSNLKILYIFTHDSINIGQDGPTHQPIEQLVMLRSIPNLDVYRPCSKEEIIKSYQSILTSKNSAALILSRSKGLNIETNNDISTGVNIIINELDYDITIIATGKEVETAYNVALELLKDKVKVRVISMVSIELFNRMNNDFKRSIINKSKPIFVIEYGSSYSWYQFVDKEYMFTIDEFGKSGKGSDVEKYYKLDKTSIINKIKEKL